jgi:hypothetical protein
VFKNRVLRKIFVHKRDVVTGECGRWRNEGAKWSVLITECYWSNQIKKNEMGGACGTHVEKRVA